MTEYTKVGIAILAITGLVVAAIVLGFLGLFAWVDWDDQTIARNVRVTSEWQEIVIDPPVSAHDRDQFIMVSAENIDFHAHNFDGVYRTDGTVLHPEIELVDEQGVTQSLRLGGLGQGHFGVDAEFRASENTDGFRRNRKFVTLRIRSDVQFDCWQIEWADYNPE
jgi:hypothetical protein